jgi:phosphatidylglycerol:prolipoprotein diacylglycerol transferase
MIVLPGFDPVAVRIGPLAVRWYGLMYAAGFAAALGLGRLRIRRGRAPLDATGFDALLSACLLGLLLGARLGYVLFYNPAHYLAHPLEAPAFWEGGMSFHGGLLGVVAAVLLFARRRHLAPLAVGDFLVPLAPPGLLAGRLGNFLNGELWGRPSAAPWAMVFPDPAAGGVPRHPSQLYEAGLEGALLFVALWTYSARPRPTGRVSGLFLLLYGCFRFGVEFTRQPDAQLGAVAFGWLTMGQLLSLPLILAGGLLLQRKEEEPGK